MARRRAWRGRAGWRRRWVSVERGVDARIDAHLGFEVVRFFLELVAELARHGARAAHPAPHLLGELGQLLRPEHDQCQREDQQQFGESDFEHGMLRRAAVGQVVEDRRERGAAL